MSINRLQEQLQRHGRDIPQQVAIRTERGVVTYAQLLNRVQARCEQIERQNGRRHLLEDRDPLDWLVQDLALLFTHNVCVPVPPFFSEQQRCHLRSQFNEGALLPPGSVKVTFTSGSTGTPKGVCLSADNITGTLLALLERIGSLPVKRHMVVMPLAILLENIAGAYLTLWLGAELILLSGREIGLEGASSLCSPTFFSALKRYRPDSLILTPALLKAVVGGVAQGYLEARQFTLLAVGGARLSLTLEQQALSLGLPVVQGYGLSEFSSVVSLNNPKNTVPGTVGTPLGHAKISFDNGEIVVAGNTMLGYVNEPESWFPKQIHTGDLGHFDVHGNLVISGRRKNIMITGFGRNIDPEWLESELAGVPAIHQVAVFGGESTPITALIVGTPDCSEQLISESLLAINQQLPDYARIQRFYVLNTAFSLSNQQLTGNGRLRRAVIEQTYQHLLV